MLQSSVGLIGLGAAAAEPVTLPKLFADSEVEESTMPAPYPPEKRLGIAIVGLGRLSLDQILPAFGASLRARPVALVSGDPAKMATVAKQYGIGAEHLYSYATYDKLKDDPLVDAVYIVLPNSMHAEYTVRAAQAGKHVLCEKPMATTVADSQKMIDACNKAGKKLMIAYRMQYEPHNRGLIAMARAGELGRLRGFSGDNGQTQGDPKQWRLNQKLAGGGALPDVGIYCINAARYLTGDEPTEVSARIIRSPKDPRFTQVEEASAVTLTFASGFVASTTSSYGWHSTKRMRLMGEDGWAEMDPAFSYTGQKLVVGKKGKDGVDEHTQRIYPVKNQFALEIDHFAQRVADNQTPHTPGEEGLQDMKIIAAAYESEKTGKPVKLAAVSKPDAFRGPPPS